MKNFLYDLKNNCSEIIFFYKKNKKFIYSGREDNDQIIYKKYPSNRSPKHNRSVVHKYFNFLFEKAGFKVKRSNCFFGTGNFNVAGSYGKIYVIFPENGFEILWSKYVTDLYENIDQFSELFFGDQKTIEKIFIFDNHFYFVFGESILLCDELMDYFENNMMYLNNKDFLKLKEYLKFYAFENFIFMFNNIFSSIKEKDIQNIKNIIEKYCKRIDTNNEITKIKQIYNDDNLLDAVKSNNEIMISGKNGCFFVEPNLVKEILISY